MSHESYVSLYGLGFRARLKCHGVGMVSKVSPALEKLRKFLVESCGSLLRAWPVGNDSFENMQKELLPFWKQIQTFR